MRLRQGGNLGHRDRTSRTRGKKPGVAFQAVAKIAKRIGLLLNEQLISEIRPLFGTDEPGNVIIADRPTVFAFIPNTYTLSVAGVG